MRESLVSSGVKGRAWCQGVMTPFLIVLIILLDRPPQAFGQFDIKS